MSVKMLMSWGKCHQVYKTKQRQHTNRLYSITITLKKHVSHLHIHRKKDWKERESRFY